MRPWKIVLLSVFCTLLLSGGLYASVAFFQNVQLADVKTNGTGINYFNASRYPVKYWDFRSQSTYHNNSGSQTVPNGSPSMNGTTQRELSIGLVPYSADGGTAMLDNLVMNPAPSPSPTPGDACGAGILEGQQFLVRGHAQSNSTFISCCYHGGSLVYQRGVCQ